MAGSGSRCFAAAAFALLLPAAGGPVLAQGAGEVDGHIQDAQSQPLPGVGVKLIKAGKNGAQDQTSDAQGNFHFSSLASGVYIAMVSKEGFAAVTCPGVRIVGGLTRSLAITLMPAQGDKPSSCSAAEENGESPPPPPPGR